MLPTHGQAATLNLGSLAPDVATVELMVRNRIRTTGAPLLLFEDYCRAVNDLPRLTRAATDHEAAVARLMMVARRVSLTPDFAGWMRYLRTQGPIHTALADPKYQRQAHFQESGLEESALVVAPRKWGKSELLKALVYHHVAPPNDQAPAAAVVVLDPGGDLALQMARWPELSGRNRARDRLRYIEPDLRDGLTVGLNPLDGRGLTHRERGKVAGMLVGAIGSLVADLTLAMRNLIRACSIALLWLPGSSMRTLHDMLSDPAENANAAELYARACDYPESEDVRGFFRQRFMSDGYKNTKQYLLNRLDEVMLTNDLAGLFGGQATLDLRAAIEARKVVLVNLAKLEVEEDIHLAGRLLVTMVAAVARKRAQNPAAARTPIYLVIDEATVLAGSELVRALAQLRKFGLNLILAQQVMGSGLSPEDKRTLIDNTGCKFIGGRDVRLVAEMLATSGTIGGELPAIERTQFWTMWPEKGGPHLLNVRDDLAGWHKHSVSDEEWAAYVDHATDKLSGYYRPAMPERATIAPSNHATMVPLHHGPKEDGPVSVTNEAAPPLDHGTMEPSNHDAMPSPLTSARLGLRKPKSGSAGTASAPRPGRSSTAKGVDLVAEVGAPRPKLRKKTSAKPVAEPGKTPEVKRTRRKLDDDP